MFVVSYRTLYCEPRAGRPSLALHRALRRMGGLVFLLVFRVLAGACQTRGVGGFSVQFFFFFLLLFEGTILKRL